MKVNNHIGKRFLTDKTFAQQIIEAHIEKNKDIITPETDPRNELTDFLLDDRSERFIVAESVVKSLSFLKLKKPYNYSAFDRSIDQVAKTYLLPNNEFIRIKRRGNTLSIGAFYLKDGNFMWNLWKADLVTGRSIIDKFKENKLLHPSEVILDQFDSTIDYYEHKVFALLCFVFLSDVEIREVGANTRTGTQKSGKILNNTDINFKLISSDWNITYVKSEGFGVSGHFALRAAGVGRTERKTVFIQPYNKEGYTRKARKDTK